MDDNCARSTRTLPQVAEYKSLRNGQFSTTLEQCQFGAIIQLGRTSDIASYLHLNSPSAAHLPGRSESAPEPELAAKP